MKIKLMLDEQRFKDKPTGFETAGIQKRIKQTEIDIKDLAYGLCNGYTCKPALLSGSKSADWIEQQVFMLDFDHDTTVGEQLEVVKNLGITPVFLYTSFSHTEKEHRFRMVFVSDSIITDIEKRNKLQLTLINLFNKSDRVTFDPTRIFYGGKGKVPIAPNYDARINADEIINKYYKDEFYIQPTKKVKKVSEKREKVVHNNDEFSSKIEAIKSLNPSKLRGLLDELDQYRDRKNPTDRKSVV